MLKEGQHWATSYAFSAQDLFIRFPFRKYLSICDDFEYQKVKSICGNIVRLFFSLVVPDIVENQVVFKLPPGTNAWMEMVSFSGDKFKEVRQNGGFQDIDFLASDFTGYFLMLKFKNRYGTWTKRLYLSAKYRDRIIELTNQGKQLVGSKIKQVRDYVDQIQEKIPILSKSEINRVLTYGLRMFSYLNRNHCDILIYPYYKVNILAFCGKLRHDSLKHCKHWHVKWRMKERMLFQLRRKVWDGYYYIGLTEEQHQEILKQKGKNKTFNNIYLVKLRAEFNHDQWVKHIWRLSYPLDCGWKFYKETLKTNRAEYVEENNYEKYHQCFLKRDSVGSTSDSDSERSVD